MKDYRLSEIKEICQKRNDCDNCDNCECGIFCSKIYTYVSLPNEWNDIILRDMIELPCKEHRVNRYGDIWDVYFRNEKFGYISHEEFESEEKANEFLAQLKGD